MLFTLISVLSEQPGPAQMQAIANEAKQPSLVGCDSDACQATGNITPPAGSSEASDRMFELPYKAPGAKRTRTAPSHSPHPLPTARPQTSNVSLRARPSTRSQQSPFTLLLGRNVHVPRRPRSVLNDYEPRKRVELEAPRRHMGRKTQAKALRNRRYTAALQALKQAKLDELQQGSVECDGDDSTGCALPVSTGSESGGGFEEGHKRASRARRVRQRKAHPVSLLRVMQSSSVELDAPQCGGVAERVIDQEDFGQKGQSDSEHPSRFVGIVSDVLANLRGE
jgi:hypothetical protein